MSATSAFPPRCEEHDTDLEWLDGSPLTGYPSSLRPVGWDCPCDPGHLAGAFTSTALQDTARALLERGEV